MKKTLLVLLSCMTIFSCMEKEIASGDVQTIAFSEKDTVSFSSYFKKFHCVQLEINDNCIIPEIKKIENVDGTLFVLTNDNQLLAFNKSDGKYLYNIGRKGEGPKEYVEASDFFITNDRKQICVVDFPTKDLKYYSLDGKFQKASKLGNEINYIYNTEIAPDGKLITNNEIFDLKNSQKYAYTIIDLENNTKVNSIEPFDPLKSEDCSTFLAQKPFTKCGNELTFIKIANDTLFKCNEDGDIYPAYKLNFKNKIFTKKQIASLGSFNPLKTAMMADNEGFFAGINKLFETKDIVLVMPLLAEMSQGYYIIDKNANGGIHIAVENDANAEIAKAIIGKSFIGMIGSDENEFICSVPSEKIGWMKDAFQKDSKIKSFCPELKAVVEKADPEGNPLLIFYEH